MVSDAVEEKDNAADKTHNGDGGDNGRRNGLRRTGHRPGRRRDRSGTKEGRRSVYEVLGEFGDHIPFRDGAAVDREALQEGELALASLGLHSFSMTARVPLAQWGAAILANVSYRHTKLTDAIV